MLKILGSIDILSALVLISIMSNVYHTQSYLFIMFLLIMKSIFFYGGFTEIGGIFDFITFILIGVGFFFVVPSVIMIIVIIFMLAKGIASLF